MNDTDAIASDWAAVGRDLRAAIEAYRPSPLDRIKRLPKRRVWFYAPALYWFGWKTLLPVTFGHDEWSRQTLVIGWSITGRIVIPIGYCGDDNCYQETLEQTLDHARAIALDLRAKTGAWENWKREFEARPNSIPTNEGHFNAGYSAGLARAAGIARRQDYGSRLSPEEPWADARARAVADAIEAEKGVSHG